MTDSFSPLLCPAIIGHDAAKRAVEAAFDAGRMPHAWLLVGPEGIGKASFAVHMAHLILSRGENRFSRFDGAHPVARLVSAGAHPDFHYQGRSLDEKTGKPKDGISVKDARKIAPFLTLTAAHGGARVVLVDEAHRLTNEAQNALLKVIEEPPESSFLLLTATVAGTLLPTIRSRCRLLTLSPLSDEELSAALARLNIDVPFGARRDRVFSCAAGSVGLAAKMLNSDVFDLFDAFVASLAKKPAPDIAALHGIADRAGKKDDAGILDVLSGLLLSLLARKVRDAALAGERLEPHLELWEKIKEMFATARIANLDPKAVLLNAAAEIGKSAILS